MPYEPSSHNAVLRSPKEVGKRIRFIRKFHGLTQPVFAKALGVHQGTVSGWETGKPRYTLGLDTAHAICDIYKATLDFIYRGEPDQLRGEMKATWIARLKAQP